ncbi:unnamed protein product [Ixodes persulcatus]
MVSFIGPRMMELARVWSRSACLYGGAGLLGVTYFTEWKDVLQYLPIYNTKYKQE